MPFLLQVGASQTANVPVTEVCLAHVLSRTFAQFQSPEEWAFVYENQVRCLLFAVGCAGALTKEALVLQMCADYIVLICLRS